MKARLAALALFAAAPAFGQAIVAIPPPPNPALEAGGNLASMYAALSGYAPGQATASIPISVAAAATTRLIVGVAGKQITIGAWDLMVAGADTVTLEYGTGTNCGTGTVALTGAYPLTATLPLQPRGTGIAPILFVPAGQDVCLVTSAAVQASGSMAYAQF